MERRGARARAGLLPTLSRESPDSRRAARGRCVGHSAAQLDGKRVAIVEGYSYGDALDFSGATLVRSRSDEDSLALLLASKTDYTLMDELVVQYLVNNYPTQASTRLDIRFTGTGDTAAVPRGEAGAARCRNDRDSLQRRGPHDDRRSYLSSSLARLVDVGGRRWRRQQRVRAGQRPVRHYGPQRAYALSRHRSEQVEQPPRRSRGSMSAGTSIRTGPRGRTNTRSTIRQRRTQPIDVAHLPTQFAEANEGAMTWVVKRLWRGSRIGALKRRISDRCQSSHHSPQADYSRVMAALADRSVG